MSHDQPARDNSETIPHQPPSATPLPPPAKPTDTPTPDQVGDFRILGVLGEGGMGCVYEAEDPKLGRRVALKVIKAESATETDRQRLLLEARGMAALHHDHVIPVLQVGEHEGTPFLVMPKLEGETLKDRLMREGPLPMEEVLRIASQIADGLAAAHEKGLVHRDIKPANIWLEAGTGRVKILDFGLVRQTVPTEDDLTGTGQILGTVSYMSPEQASGQRVGPPSDLFSLGTVIFRMVTGEEPFQRDTFFDTLHAIRWDEPRFPSHPESEIPGPLADLILWLLEKDPTERPESAAQVRDALTAIAKEDDTSVILRKPVEHGRSGSKKVSLLGGILVVMVFLVSVGAVVWLKNNGNEGRPSSSEHAKNVGGTPPIGEQQAPVKGWIDIKVWPKEQVKTLPGGDFELQGRSRRLDEFGALPIEPGDWMQIDVELDQPRYMYIVWLDSQGGVTPLYPWKDDWTEREPEKKLTQLRIPQDPKQDALPVGEGPSGVESLVLLTRENPLPAGEDVAALFAGLPTQKELKDLDQREWLENGKTVTDETDRAAVLKGVGAAKDDPVRPFRVALQAEKVKELFPYTRAVCFTYRGE